MLQSILFSSSIFALALRCYFILKLYLLNHMLYTTDLGFWGMLSKFLRVFDDSLKIIKEIGLKDSPNKLLLLEDKEHLLCGESNGNIDILKVPSWHIIQSFKISSGNLILDIVKISKENQYALGLYGGVQIVEIRRT